ncbi:MAG: nucleotidyltransferase domain-containing protein [Chloroflexi bacterium]|nr:nucleotidyltransferase domain-containing protein [Chloroflexota bacterium]
MREDLTEPVGSAQPADALLDEVVARIRLVASPERIILFGSAARGERRASSDLDLLVVAPTGTHRRRLAQAIYEQMIGLRAPVDIVVVTLEDIEQYGQAAGLVLEPALREGLVLYERAGAAA